jgi:hypothetical protein
MMNCAPQHWHSLVRRARAFALRDMAEFLVARVWLQLALQHFIDCGPSKLLLHTEQTFATSGRGALRRAIRPHSKPQYFGGLPAVSCFEKF